MRGSLEAAKKIEAQIIEDRRTIHRYPEMGFELVERITEDLGEDGTVESPAKLLGKNINVTFNPKGTH